MDDAGFPIIGYDVNNDGKADIIYGHGHSYGVYWLEQQGDAAGRHWVKHVIDESYSQIHALKLVDIDGDGAPELVAGKRYRGHNGTIRDPMIRCNLLLQDRSKDRTVHALSISLTEQPGQERSSLRKTWTGMEISISPPQARQAFISTRI